MTADPFAGIRLPSLAGIPVVQSDLATRQPTPGEDARRIVRHGLSDVLEWLGEDVGPRPGERVPTAYLMAGKVVAHRAVVQQMREGWGV